jgi:surface carbohydrate biosynthesis protein
VDKPTIYFCIELKNRELDSQILLASKLVNEGFRCYIGTHASIFSLLKAKKSTSGVFFDKGTLPYEKMKWVRKKCEAIVILDQELSPATSDPLKELTGWPSRIYPNTEKFIDKFFCVGPKTYSAALLRFDNDLNKVVMTGWPRVDMWRWYGASIYGEEIANIRKTYGNFLLFVSSFGVSSDVLLTNPDSGYVSSNNSEFLYAISTIKHWDSDQEFPKVIVRPHISEDVRIWERTLKGVRKTYVNKDSNVTPWVLASSGVIHSGSTVSLEAKLAGKPVNLLMHNAKVNLRELTTIASDYIVNKDDRKYITGKESALSNFVFLENEPSINRIIIELKKLDLTSQSKANKLKVALVQFNIYTVLRLIGLLKHEIEWKLKLTMSPAYSNFMPKGIRKKDILKITSKERISPAIKIRRVTLNCWELE